LEKQIQHLTNQNTLLCEEQNLLSKKIKETTDDLGFTMQKNSLFIEQLYKLNKEFENHKSLNKDLRIQMIKDETRIKKNEIKNNVFGRNNLSY